MDGQNTAVELDANELLRGLSQRVRFLSEVANDIDRTTGALWSKAHDQNSIAVLQTVDILRQELADVACALDNIGAQGAFVEPVYLNNVSDGVKLQAIKKILLGNMAQGAPEDAAGVPEIF